MRSCLKETKRIKKNNIIFSPVIKIRKMGLYCVCVCVWGWVWSPFILFPETVSLTGLAFTDYGKQAGWPASPGSHQPLRPRCWDWKQEPLQAAFLMASGKERRLWCLRGPLLPAPSPSPCTLSLSSIICFYLRCFRLRKHMVYRNKKPRVRTGRTAFKTRIYFKDEKVFKDTAQAAPGPSSGFSPNI